MLSECYQFTNGPQLTNEDPQAFGLHPLTPSDEADIGIYELALNEVFCSPLARNIAISGPYGAGKSTVFRSYINKKSQADSNKITVETISLAHFRETRLTEKVPQKFLHDESTKHLESEIIGQLVLKLDPKRISESRFCRPVESNKRIIIVHIVLLISLILSSAFCLHQVHLFDSLIPQEIRVWLDLSFLVLASFLFGYLLYRLYLLQRTRGIIKSVATKDCSFEVFKDEENSFIDKNLEDVIFLFEHAGCRNFAFEDLDRHGNIQVFEQLRKVNDILNARNRTNVPYRFFYMVRDGLFASNDRTKFFDLIIPIIPYVDHKNSLDLLIDRLTKIDCQVSKNTLALIGARIGDMRMLNNICNEYLIYWRRLGASTYLNQEKLLSFVTYKSLYPHDYDLLCYGAGALNTLFDRESCSIASTAIREKIAVLENEIDQLDMLMSEKGDIGSVKHSRQRRLDEIDYWKKAQPDEYIRRTSIREMIAESPRAARQVKQLLGESLYLSGDALGNDRCNFGALGESTPHSLNAGLNIQGWTAKNIEYNCEMLFALIANGLIDESFHDYLSYFHEGRITKNDKTFIRRVLDGSPLPFDFPLENPQEVLEDLSEGDLGTVAALNFSLVEHALQKNDDDALRVIAESIAKESRIDFILDFETFSNNHSGIQLAAIVNDVSKHELLYKIILGAINNATDEMRFRMTCCVLRGASPSSFKTFQHKKAFQVFCDDHPQLIEELAVQIDYFANALDCLAIMGIRLSKLECLADRSWAIKQVAQRDLFGLNSGNIEVLVSEYHHELGRNWERYCNILTTPHKTVLSKRIASNLDDFMRIFNDRAPRADCNSKSALLILNSPSVSQHEKTRFAKKLTNAAFNVEDFEDGEVLDLALENQLLSGSSDNLLLLIKDSSEPIPDKIISFINKTNRFNLNNIAPQHLSLLEPVLTSVLLTPSISRSALKSIFSTAPYQCKTLDVRGVPDENMRAFIESGSLLMNEDNLLFMRGWYPNQLLYFIELNLMEYVKCLRDDYEPESGELEKVLSSNSLSDNEKLILLSHIDSAVCLRDVAASDAVCVQIMREHLGDTRDLVHIIETFDDQSESVRRALVDVIASLTAGRADAIGACPVSLLKELSKKNQGYHQPSFETILANSVPRITLDNFVEIASLSQEHELRSIADSIFGATCFPLRQSTGMTRLLMALKERGWILDFESERGEIRILSKNLSTR